MPVPIMGTVANGNNVMQRPGHRVLPQNVTDHIASLHLPLTTLVTHLPLAI